MFIVIHLIITIVFTLVAMISGFVINIKNVDLKEHSSLLLTANILGTVAVLLLVSGVAMPTTVKIASYEYMDAVMTLAAILLAVVFSLHTYLIVKVDTGKEYLITAATASLVALVYIIGVPTFISIRRYVAAQPAATPQPVATVVVAKQPTPQPVATVVVAKQPTPQPVATVVVAKQPTPQPVAQVVQPQYVQVPSA